MAHPEGLGLAIQGDRLYQGHYPDSLNADGCRVSDAAMVQPLPGHGRLLLHAQYLAFDHPESGIRKSFQSPAMFLENGQE